MRRTAGLRCRGPAGTHGGWDHALEQPLADPSPRHSRTHGRGWHLGARAGGLLERGVILQPRPIRFPQFPLPGGAGSHVARPATAPGGSEDALSVRAGCRRPLPQDVAPGRGKECALGPWMDRCDPWTAARGFQCFCVLNARIHRDACVPGFSVADEGRNAAELFRVGLKVKMCGVPDLFGWVGRRGGMRRSATASLRSSSRASREFMLRAAGPGDAASSQSGEEPGVPVEAPSFGAGPGGGAAGRMHLVTGPDVRTGAGEGQPQIWRSSVRY